MERNDNNVAANNGSPPPGASSQGDIIISVAGPRTSFISFKFSLLLCALKGFLDNGAAEYESEEKRNRTVDSPGNFRQMKFFP